MKRPNSLIMIIGIVLVIGGAYVLSFSVIPQSLLMDLTTVIDVEVPASMSLGQILDRVGFTLRNESDEKGQVPIVITIYQGDARYTSKLTMLTVPPVDWSGDKTFIVSIVDVPMTLEGLTVVVSDYAGKSSITKKIVCSDAPVPDPEPVWEPFSTYKTIEIEIKDTATVNYYRATVDGSLITKTSYTELTDLIDDFFYDPDEPVWELYSTHEGIDIEIKEINSVKYYRAYINGEWKQKTRYSLLTALIDDFLYDPDFEPEPEPDPDPTPDINTNFVFYGASLGVLGLIVILMSLGKAAIPAIPNVLRLGF